jgi:hypothetical protein
MREKMPWPIPAFCHRIMNSRCEASIRSLWYPMCMLHSLTCKQVTSPATWDLTCEYAMELTATRFHSGPTRYRSQASEARGYNTALFQTSPLRDTDWFLKRGCGDGARTAWRRKDMVRGGFGRGAWEWIRIVVKCVVWLAATLYST